MHLDEVENQLLETVMNANVLCMEEVGLWEVTHDIGIMPKHIESSVNMSGGEFGIGYLGVGLAECSI